jgi:hypothetical protein
VELRVDNAPLASVAGDWGHYLAATAIATSSRLYSPMPSAALAGTPGNAAVQPQDQHCGGDG